MDQENRDEFKWKHPDPARTNVLNKINAPDIPKSFPGKVRLPLKLEKKDFVDGIAPLP